MKKIHARLNSNRIKVSKADLTLSKSPLFVEVCLSFSQVYWADECVCKSFVYLLKQGKKRLMNLSKQRTKCLLEFVNYFPKIPQDTWTKHARIKNFFNQPFTQNDFTWLDIYMTWIYFYMTVFILVSKKKSYIKGNKDESGSTVVYLCCFAFLYRSSWTFKRSSHHTFTLVNKFPSEIQKQMNIHLQCMHTYDERLLLSIRNSDTFFCRLQLALSSSHMNMRQREEEGCLKYTTDYSTWPHVDTATTLHLLVCCIQHFS